MCQKPRNVLSLCPLNFILLPSSLCNQEGRCYSSLGFGSTCQFDSSYKSSQDDSPYCSMCTLSFLLYSSSSRSSSWSFEAPLETLTCLSFAQVDFYIFSFFLNPPLNLQQPKLGLWKVWWFPSSPTYLVPVWGITWTLQLRHIPGSSSQFSGMEGKKKHWIVRTNLIENDQN